MVFPKSAVKRLYREIEKEREKGGDTQLHFIEDPFDRDRLSYIRLWTQIRGCDIVFTISNKYPFKPPLIDITYGGGRYLKYYRDLLCSSYNEEIKNMTGKKCLCCESITCLDNWSPMMNIKQIIDEIKQNMIIKDRLYERLVAKQLIHQKLNKDIPLLSYL
jgi:hypothetical protein